MSINSLTLQYRHLDEKSALFADYLRNARRFETDLFIPHRDSRSALEQQLAQYHQEVDDLLSPDSVFEIMKEHFSQFLASQEKVLASSYTRPARYVNNITYTVTNLSRKDSREASVRADIMLKRLKQSESVWQGIMTWLEDASATDIQELINAQAIMVETITKEAHLFPERFLGLDTRIIGALQQTVETVCQQSEVWRRVSAEILSKKGIPVLGMLPDDACIPFEESYYRSLLWNELGVDLDQLLDWYQEEIEKTRNEVFEIAAKLPITEKAPKTMKEINSILLKYAGPKNTPEEMFEAGRKYLAISRASCREHVWLPDDEVCELNPVPEQLKVSYPWGGYGGGDATRRPLIGEMFLNNYNYKAVTDGWIKMNTVHEAYPGHHVQFVRNALDETPETVKLGSRAVPLIEGTCHRSERVFLKNFPEDPFYPLFVAYRRHHTSVRIKVDLGLRYFGTPIGTGVKTFMDELDFDYRTARGQVQAMETMQGYFTCYYYGYKRLMDLEKEYRFDEKRYTELLFAAGRVSLETFEKFLSLSESDRQRYCHDFKSIIQFGV